MTRPVTVTAAEAEFRAYRARRNVEPPDNDDWADERVAVTLFSELSLEHLILSAACEPEFTSLFRASAPDWNRSFLWRGVDPQTDGVGSLALQTLIQSSFAEATASAADADAAASKPNGYRWTWLALNGVQLKVASGAADEQRFRDTANCQLAIDQWHAAYFLDFGNQPRFRLRRMLRRLMNWRFSLSHFGMI
jgi:superoxide dismutase